MPKKILVAIFLVSLSILIFEISLIRIFSVLMRYHFVFLIVSMAMCGLGFGGILSAYLRKKIQNEEKITEIIFFLVLITSISIPLSVILILKTPLKDFLLGYTAISIIPFIPFMIAGAFFSYVFETYGSIMGKLYFSDLIGAGAGCLVVLYLLKIFGGINTVFFVSAIIAMASFILAWKSLTWKKPIISVIMFFACFSFVFLNFNHKFFKIPFISSKNPEATKPLFTAAENNSAQIIYTEWNAFARTDVVEFSDLPDIKYIYTDGDVPTTMHFFDGSIESISSLKNTVFYLPFADLKKPEVLSIGPGGGLDILVSVLGGSSNITGVEVNPSIFSIMDKFSYFNGNIYRYPGVKVYLDDGRSFVKRTKEKYDIIYLALTQSATGQAATGVLTEGYIHTRDAFKDYLEKLNDDGMIVFITQNELLLFRAFATFLSILNQPHTLGGLPKMMVFMSPEEQFATTPYRYVLIAGKTDFSRERKEKMKDMAEKLGIKTIFIPGIVAKPPFDKFGDFVDLHTFVSTINSLLEKPVNIMPVSDDQPFFLDLSFGVPSQFKKLLISILIAVILCAGYVLKNSRERSNITMFFIMYFALIGTGYMLIEIFLIQKFMLFLGHPTFAVSIVLFSMLAGSGIGSFVSQMWEKQLIKKVMISALITGLIFIFYLLFLTKIFDIFLYQTRYLRILISVILILPAGFIMGIPFPSGIRIIKKYHTSTISWLWAINGLMSVCGSVLAMVIGKTMGFSSTLMTGALLYILLFFICYFAKNKNWFHIDSSF
ncbi:MAG: hypothetical protein NC825_01495 [Candidatus Omnitrophica bacterium]|nr:hypothetical protein [Candidatus Omnitrophota bacterium]